MQIVGIIEIVTSSPAKKSKLEGKGRIQLVTLWKLSRKMEESWMTPRGIAVVVVPETPIMFQIICTSKTSKVDPRNSACKKRKNQPLNQL